MHINKTIFNPTLVILSISGGSLWSQAVQAADTIPVTITGVIQAPAVSNTNAKAIAASREVGQIADTIPVTMTGVIQAPAISITGTKVGAVTGEKQQVPGTSGRVQVPAARKTDTKNGVVIEKTRVIYDGNQKESTVAIQNQGKEQWLVQSSVDNDGIQGRNAGKPKPPFDVSPALLRLGPDGNSSLHIRQASGNPPVDRESVYWLDIKTIPDEQHKQVNTLTMSVIQRLKLFYRPVGIKAPADADYRKLMFSKDGENLRVSNPTPYYVTFYSLKVGGEDIQTNGRMVPPKSAVSYKLASGVIIQSHQITWQVINDNAGSSQLFTGSITQK